MVGVNHKEAKKRLQQVIADSKSRSLRAFALSINIDPSLMAKVIGDQRTLTAAMVKAITEKYKVNESWLLYGEGEKYGQNGTGKPADSLPGTVTLQDHIAEIQARRQDAERYASKMEAEKDRLYGIIENYLNSIQANSVKTQDDLKILKAQADIVIKQIARQDEAILQSQLPKSEIVKGDKVKRGV